MPTLSVKAHFDGERIVLDEPATLPLNTQFLMTVWSPEDLAERDAWTRAGLASLARAYGPDEPEYTLADLKK